MSLVFIAAAIFAVMCLVYFIRSRSERARWAAVAVALVCLSSAAALAGGDLRTTLPSTVALHTKMIVTPEQPAATANSFRTATTMFGLPVGSVISPSTAIVPGVVGRNVTITQTNAGGVSNPVVTYRVECRDQFGVLWAESITANNTTVAVGAKVCQTFVRAVIEATTGVESGDTVAMGIGNVVGIPAMYSLDLREVIGLERVVAAGTTQTALAISTANLDTTNFACRASCFASSLVTNGDHLNILLRTDDRTPDYRFPPR